MTRDIGALSPEGSGFPVLRAPGLPDFKRASSKDPCSAEQSPWMQLLKKKKKNFRVLAIGLRGGVQGHNFENHRDRHSESHVECGVGGFLRSFATREIYSRGGPLLRRPPSP